MGAGERGSPSCAGCCAGSAAPAGPGSALIRAWHLGRRSCARSLRPRACEPRRRCRRSRGPRHAPPPRRGARPAARAGARSRGPGLVGLPAGVRLGGDGAAPSSRCSASRTSDGHRRSSSCRETTNSSRCRRRACAACSSAARSASQLAPPGRRTVGEGLQEADPAVPLADLADAGDRAHPAVVRRGAHATSSCRSAQVSRRAPSGLSMSWRRKSSMRGIRASAASASGSLPGA